MSYDNYNTGQDYGATGYASMPGLYYKPSGKFSATAPFIMMIFGGIAAIIFGAIYAYISVYNPMVFLNFIATGIFGFILGIAVTMGSTSGKVRAPWLAGLVGLLVGLMGLYFHWVIWSHAALARAEVPGAWFINPIELFYFLSGVADEGA
jgi:hypothetical protein